MVDICMCGGEGCLIKEKCYRFTAVADKWQSYFAKPPVKEDKTSCDHFMPNNLEKIFDDAMKKEGFKSIPVGPLPLKRL